MIAKKEYIYVGTWSKLQSIVIIDIHRTKHDKARKIKTHLSKHYKPNEMVGQH